MFLQQYLKIIGKLAQTSSIISW